MINKSILCKVTSVAVVAMLSSSLALAGSPTSWNVCSKETGQAFRVERLGKTKYAELEVCPSASSAESECQAAAIINLAVVKHARNIERLKGAGLVAADGLLTAAGVAAMIYGGWAIGATMADGAGVIGTALGLGAVGKAVLVGASFVPGVALSMSFGRTVADFMVAGVKKLDPRKHLGNARDLAKLLPHKADANGCSAYGDAKIPTKAIEMLATDGQASDAPSIADGFDAPSSGSDVAATQPQQQPVSGGQTQLN